MAEIAIYVAENETRVSENAAIGFFGDSGFGAPVQLHDFNGRTFITDSSGVNQGLEIDNCRLIHNIPEWNGPDGPSGVIIGQTGNGIGILNLPNYLATLNIRFTDDVPRIVQNASIVAHNGDGETPPEGVLVYMADLIHTSELQTEEGAGSPTWVLVSGISNPLILNNSPGISGTFPFEGADARHDWYIPVSCSPKSPNNKLFYFTIALEYL